MRGPTVPPEDSITLSINIAMYLLSGIEYLEAKAELAHTASRKFDSYNSDYVQADTLQNQIIRGTLSKASALENLNNAIVANDECFQLMKNYLVKEPTQDPYEGSQMLLGRNNFTNDIDDASITAALNEGRNEELRAGLRTIDERQIPERRNISYFETRYQHLVQIYATIQVLMLEVEELQVDITRLCTHLRRDLAEFAQEVY